MQLIATCQLLNGENAVSLHGTVWNRRGTVAEPSYVSRFVVWNRLEPSWNRRGTVAFAVFLHIPGAWNHLEPSWNRRGTVLFAVFSHTPGAFTLHGL